jgi:hypothetical protein
VLCTPCQDNTVCGGGKTLCLTATLDDGGVSNGFCATPCSVENDCPVNFDCEAITLDDGGDSNYCVPHSGFCPNQAPPPADAGHEHVVVEPRSGDKGQADAGVADSANHPEASVAVDSAKTDGSKADVAAQEAAASDSSKVDTTKSADACTNLTYLFGGSYMRSYCAYSGCHAPGADGAAPAALPDLSTYAGVKANISAIQTQVQDGLMPPAGSLQPTATANSNLLAWLACGAPQ